MGYQGRSPWLVDPEKERQLRREIIDREAPDNAARK
jgi:hypothetical protein